MAGKEYYDKLQHRPIATVNRLGFADYRCGMCGGMLLRLTCVEDVNVPFPKKCPNCGEYVFDDMNISFPGRKRRKERRDLEDR